MILKNQKIKTKWVRSTKNKFIALGYAFTEIGEEFEVYVKDLSEGSNLEIPIQCDVCKEAVFTKSYKQYTNAKKRKPNSLDVCAGCQKEDSSLRPRNARLSYEEIKSAFEERGCELLTPKEEYKNTTSSIEYICGSHKEKGAQSTTWHYFKKMKHNCHHCATESNVEHMKSNYDKYYKNHSKPRKYSLEMAKEAFESRGFKLLETEYKTDRYPMKYICKRHEDKGVQTAEFRSVYNLDKHPHVCKWCTYDAQSGEKSHFWKGGVTEETKIIRDSMETAEWRRAVFSRDKFTCQCCGDSTGHNLQAHHIENFSEVAEKRFDVSNGVTMCKDCHDPSVKGSFHHTYGTRNNSREQLEEYFKNRQKEGGYVGTLPNNI
jgi:hypothetical protein